MTRKQETEAARQKALASLSFLRPGDVVYTELLSVSRSGMTRWVKPFVIRDSAPQRIGGDASTVLGYPMDRNGGVKMGGCGMDMGFALVYGLSRSLFPDGFGEEGDHPLMGKLRPLTREKAAEAVAEGWSFYGRNGDRSGWDNDGGYALVQKWL